MKIRDLNLDDHVIVYDIGKSENSEGMTVVGKVVGHGSSHSVPFIIIRNATRQEYEITDNNYFDLWSNYIESKTERVSTPNPGKIYSYSNSTVGPNEEIISHSQSNDVQQRKRKDNVNSPSHYMLGNHEVKDIVSLVADKYHKGSVAHNIASALEYQMRAPEKNGLEDIKKARKCLDFAVENWDVK